MNIFRHAASRRLSATLLTASAIAFTTQACAGPLLVSQIQVNRTIAATYHCPGGKSLKVTYFNSSNGQSFALMPVDGVPTLLVSTMSADGVRYQSGFVTWWNKGRGGDFYDARVNPDRPVLQGCTAD
jgi:membrane-bound inhibitor of C-type lysozyme